MPPRRRNNRLQRMRRRTSNANPLPRRNPVRNTNVTQTKAVSGNDKPIIKRTQTGTSVSFNGPGGGSRRGSISSVPYGQGYQGSVGGTGDFYNPDWNTSSPFYDIMNPSSQWCQGGGPTAVLMNTNCTNAYNTGGNCCHGDCGLYQGCNTACHAVCNSYPQYAGHPNNYGQCINHDNDFIGYCHVPNNSWEGWGTCMPPQSPNAGEACQNDTECLPNTQTPKQCKCHCYTN